MKRISLILVLCISFNVGFTQSKDSIWIAFTNSDLFFEISGFLESQGEDVFFEFEGKKYANYIAFINLLTNSEYEICDIGIWKVGVISSHPNFYLLFRYNGKCFFEESNIGDILKRLQDFFNAVEFSDNKKLILLFGVVKYLNECKDYPIECIVPDCYSITPNTIEE